MRANQAQDEQAKSDAGRLFIAIVFIVLAVAITGVEHLVIRYERKSIGREAGQHLTAVADLKVRQVTSWISERQASAKVLGDGSFLANEIARWLERGAVKGDAASAIKSQLALIARSYGYRIVTLVDTQSRPLLSTDEPARINEAEEKAAAEAIRTGNTVISVFHLPVREIEGESEIDVLTPVYAGENKAVPVAALIFDIDPNTSLRPLIESWPTPSRSGETLLVKRHGERVTYLTHLRHRQDAPFKLHLPIDQPDLVEAMALRGQQGVVTGVDYRGVDVLAVLRLIPDSPWLLVAKVDSAEIYEPVQKLAVITAVVTAIFILAAALTTNAWVRAQRKNEEKFRRFAETEHKRAEEALRQVNAELEERVQSRTAELERSHKELQALTAVMESLEEEERKRIARELHDELAQKLTVLKLQFQSLASAFPANEPGLTKRIRNMTSLLTETMQAVERIAANLRPVVLDELGLLAALHDLVERFSQEAKIECEFSVHPPDLSVDNRLVTPLYRMVQEALTNVARHAQATEVIVSLFRDPSGTIILNVSDNGKGLSNEDQRRGRSFGLIGMRERAAMLGGEMKIYSEPGAGTSIEIVIPRSPDQPQADAGENQCDSPTAMLGASLLPEQTQQEPGP